MKILFIFPKGQSHNFWDMKFSSRLTERKYSGIPLALPTLAALTPLGIDIEICDENAKDIDFDSRVDLVGISFFTAFAGRAYEIADEFRKRRVTVVMGGIHASSLPDEALKHCDSVVAGEAEQVWQQVVMDFKAQSLKPVYAADPKDRREVLHSPIPRWDLVGLKRYNFHSVQATRGCPFDCEFCSVKSFFGTKLRYKPVREVMEEVKYLHKINKKTGIVFADDNIMIDRDYTKELIRQLMNAGVKHWWCQSAITIAKHEDVLKLMAESGCTQIFIGFESVSQKSLEAMNKGSSNKSEDYAAAIEKIHSFGISVFGSFILGSDADSEDIFKDTVDFIMRTNIAFALVGILVPFPGTRLFARLKDEGRLLHQDWSRYNGENVCFRPKLMSAEKLAAGHRWVLEKIYSYDALTQRLGYLWKKGVLVKHASFAGRYLSLPKAAMALRAVVESLDDRARIGFLLKSLYNEHNPRFFSILAAIDFHDVVNEYLRTNA